MEDSDFTLSVNLVESALGHLLFLDQVASLERVFTGDVLSHALKRYEQLWLPLYYKNNHVKMEPPIDVAWFWYIHMLQPLAYRRDCRKMFKETLDHNFKDQTKLISSINNAIEVWYEAYPKEGFNIIRNEEYVRPQRNKGEIKMEKSSKLSVDLLAYSDSHMCFCYQVALPHFRDSLYLESALQRYKQFMRLKALEPNEFLTPSVDILLMWYTHMCNPVAYAKDMMQICGRVLDNNVKVKSGPVDELYITARNKTSDLWKKVSKEELIKPGSSFRSKDRQKEIFAMTTDNLKDICVMTYKLHLTRSAVYNVPRRSRRIELKLDCIFNNGNCKEVLALDGHRTSWALSTTFVFNTLLHKEFRIVLNTSHRLLCYEGDSNFANFVLDIRRSVETMSQMERVFVVSTLMDNQISDKMKFELEGALGDAAAVLCDLTLQRHGFNKEMLRKQAVRKVLGLSGVTELSKNEEYMCYIANHGFTNHEGKEIFQCKVIHIQEMVYSAIEIRCKNKLVALSRLIGSSQLPKQSQVGSESQGMAFDPELGERAMLVRNHTGDWGVCVAKWQPKSQGSEEHLEVRFFKLSGPECKVQRAEIKAADIELMSFNASLFSGKVLINPSNNMLAENLALVWSISVLYVLCSPVGVNRTLAARTTDITSEDTDSSTENIKSLTQIPEKNCQFLIAAGLGVETPSNHFMQRTYGTLTFDVHMGTLDITVEERKSDKKLLKKESKISLANSEAGETPRERKKKKRSCSKLKVPKDIANEDGNAQGNNQEVSKDTANEVHVDNQTSDHNATYVKKSDDQVIEPAKVVVKRRVKKRQSSKLEDELPMSDDSITKDDVEEVKLVKDGRGKKRAIIKKISSNLNEEIKPEDSLDEEEKEKEEFFEGLKVNRLCPRQKELELSKEQTTLIKDVVNKKKHDMLDKELEDTGLADVESDRVTFHLGSIPSIKHQEINSSYDDRSDHSGSSHTQGRTKSRSRRNKSDDEENQLSEFYSKLQ